MPADVEAVPAIVGRASQPTYLLAGFEHVFSINQAQAEIGKWILLIIGVNVAINFPFSVYGGVSSGFQDRRTTDRSSTSNTIAPNSRACRRHAIFSR